MQGEPDWERLPLILSEQGLARKRCDQWFRNKGIAPNIYAEVAGNEGIVAMVALGFGVGLVPAAVIDHSPMGEKVRIVEPDRRSSHSTSVSQCSRSGWKSLLSAPSGIRRAARVHCADGVAVTGA